MSEIKKGDTVWLKSGGPMMTVSEIEEHSARCVWLDNSGKQQTGEFDLDTLKPAKPVESPKGPRTKRSDFM